MNGFHPIYISNYTTCPLSLPMDLSIKIDKSNEAVSFAEVMKEMNLRKYFKTVSRGNRGYNKEAMLKVLLFAFSLRIRSLREIESLYQKESCKINFLKI